MKYIAPHEKLLGHLPRLAALQTGQTPPPINAEIDLSNRCSLGCEWCHFAYTHTRGPLAGSSKPTGAIPGGDLMAEALAYRIIRELDAGGVESITWTGGGEPTLHPAFDSIIDTAAAVGIPQGLYTNGCHIKHERARLLKSAMSWVYVSLDAVDQGSYRAAKGIDRFADATDGIRRLVAAPGDATIGVGFLVTRDNWEDVAKMARLGEDIGADYVQLRPTVRYDQDSPDDHAEDTEWLSEAIRLIAATAEYHPILEADPERFEAYRDWKGHGYSTCWWSGLQTCITPNGKMWTCVNKREHQGSEVGDLALESFADIWSRRAVASVSSDCRVMCRGHIANLALDQIMAPRAHAEFV